MKNNRIVIKLFLVTSIVFILFISVTLVMQILFFEKYYVSKKLSNFKGDLKELSGEMGKSSLDQDAATIKFKKFDDDNTSKSVILNITDFDYHMINGSVQSDLGYIFYTFDKKVNSTIIPLILREWGIAERTGYDSYILGGNTLIYQKTISSTNYIIGISPIIKNGTVDNIIFSLVSLQPVGDAVKTMKEFYIYIYIFAIALIVALSLIYSIMIAKPLVELKKTASKMTELDFTTKYEVKSKDEIGELGGILNFLSEKLDKTLNELKESNEKLRSDIEKERQLEIMRKEFVAGVSHELKTPITLIGGYAEALKDKVVDAEDKDFFVDVILDESKKMDYLVKDMLDLSQLETGNMKMNFEEFNIIDLINFVMKKFSKTIADKSLKLQTDFYGEYAIVHGDVIRIEQVLVNLISNAMKHSPEGGVIKLIIEKTLGGVVLALENEGDKIPEDEIDKIWERFYKVDKSRNRETEGTGIGLSIVKNILFMHNSNFGCKNTDTGVRFYFTLKSAEGN